MQTNPPEVGADSSIRAFYDRAITRGVIFIVLILCLRAATMEVLDLIDPTESRYAFVSQEMYLSKDWLTPKLPSINGTEPYLGKPPLHFWIGAAVYSMFDVDEWTTRLPSFLATLVTCGMMFLFATNFFSRSVAVHSVLIALSSGLFFFFAGGSVVDATLSACIAGSLVSFALGHNEKFSAWGRRFWSLGAFVFLGLGFLTKGPVAIVLVALPLLLWAACTRSFARLLSAPWVLGAFLFLLIVAPWFIMEEQANPDFLRYYFVQENFQRYLIHDYGDRYGTGHVYMRGSVWWMAALSFLPWTLLLGMVPWKALKTSGRAQCRRENVWGVLCSCLGACPCDLFYARTTAACGVCTAGYSGNGALCGAAHRTP